MTMDVLTDRTDGTDEAARPCPTTGRTKKELAGRAGVSTKTLRRIETGGRVSEKTRSKVRAALDAEPDAGPIRTAHLDALRELRAITNVSDQEWMLKAIAIVSLRCFLPLMTILTCLGIEKIVRRPEIAWEPLTVTFYLLVVLFFSVTAISSRFYRRCERRDRDKAVTLAPAILEGVRMGSIRYLQKNERKMIREAVGARALGDAMRASPRHVHIA